MHRALVSAHHVHVLHVPRTGGVDAHHVVGRELESDNVWIALVRRPVDTLWKFRAVEVADA